MIPDAVVRATKKEIKLLEKKVKDMEYWMYANPFDPKNAKDRDRLMKYQTTGTVEKGRRWSDMQIEIDDIKSWLAWEVWLKNRKLTKRNN